MKIIYKDGHVDECPQDQELHKAAGAKKPSSNQ